MMLEKRLGQPSSVVGSGAETTGAGVSVNRFSTVSRVSHILSPTGIAVKWLALI